MMFVKYYPVLMQVIMLASIFDEFYPFSITNWLYPILGHSLSWDLFLLAFSRMFRFCIWHRLLIYSMIFNICVEWVTVNIEMPIEQYRSVVCYGCYSFDNHCLYCFKV